MLKWIQEHQALTGLLGAVLAAIIIALGTIYAAYLGRPWNSSIGPPAKPPSEALVQPDIVEPILERETKPVETTAEAQPIPSAPTLPHPEPVWCENIDRSSEDVLSQSVFDLQDTIEDMIGEHTSLGIKDFKRRYWGLRVIDCGYIRDNHQ